MKIHIPTEVQASRSLFLRHNLLRAYVDILGDERPEWNRRGIYEKINLIIAALEGGQGYSPGLTQGICTKADRSKVIMLMLGLKYRIIKSAFSNIEDYLGGAREGDGRAELTHLVGCVERLDELVREVIASVKLALH